MKKLDIRIYPDPALKQKCEPVTEFDDDLKQLVEDMIYTMLVAPGAGLAAPQVGILKRLIVTNGEYFESPQSGLVFINPKIISTEGSVVKEEGCLSLPDIYGEVERAEKVKLEAQDLEGNWHTFEYVDWAARILLHECDHLEGIVYPERMTGLKKDMVLKKVKKMMKERRALAKQKA